MVRIILMIAALGIAASFGPARAETGPEGGSGVSFTFSNLESNPRASGGYLQSSRENAREKSRMDTRNREDAEMTAPRVEIKTIRRGRTSGGAKFMEIDSDGTVIERRF